MSDFLLELPDPVPENVVDLDEYRKRRREDGSWPLLDDLEYWRRRLREKRERTSGGGGGGGSAAVSSELEERPASFSRSMMDALWGPRDPDVHPI